MRGEEESRQRAAPRLEDGLQLDLLRLRIRVRDGLGEHLVREDAARVDIAPLRVRSAPCRAQQLRCHVGEGAHLQSAARSA